LLEKRLEQFVVIVACVSREGDVSAESGLLS